MADILDRLSCVKQFTLRTDVAKLLPSNSIGIELGVAEGKFSECLLRTGRFEHLYSVDMWQGDRGHDTEQYKSALHRLLRFKSNNTVLRMTFDEAVDLFPNEYFDFIYIDGYAHTGEEEGKTFRQWWPKLKTGGVMAGDDYSEAWPLVIKAVDEFIAEYNLTMEVLHFTKTNDIWSQYPTWLTIKPEKKLENHHLYIHIAADARYQAGVIRHEYSSEDHAQVISRFHDLNLDLLPFDDAVRTSNFYFASVKQSNKEAAPTLPPACIGKAVEYALRGSAASDADILDKLDAITNPEGNWFGPLRFFAEDKVPELAFVLSDEAAAITPKDMFSFISAIRLQGWEWWCVMYARLLKLGYVDAAYHAKATAAQLLIAEQTSTPSQIAAAGFFIEPRWDDYWANARPFAPFNTVTDKTVLLVTNTPEDDRPRANTEVVARLNQLARPSECEGQTEVLYCSQGFYWPNKRTIQSSLDKGDIAAAVILANGETDSLYEHELFRSQSPQPPTFLGFGYAGRRILCDLASLGASNITLCGIDFFLAPTAVQNHNHSRSYLLHDPLDMWRCLKSLRSTGRLTTDDFLSTLLELEEKEFLRRLGIRVAPHLYTSELI